jgi:N-acetyl-anhydromuramyl-L-alanine amidase AmpD
VGEKKPAGKAKPKEKKKLPTPTRFFVFTDHATIVDLETAPLRIQQETLFIPEGKDEEDVTLELWEYRGDKRERAPFQVAKITGKVKRADGFNIEIVKVEQDPKNVPKPKNAKGTELWMETRLEILGKDGKARGIGAAAPIKIVLPPMEYDDTLELQLGSTLPGSVNGQAKVTWGTFDGMIGLPVEDKTEGVPRGEAQVTKGGNLKVVVIHCMCGIFVVGDEPTRSFETQPNVEIFKNSSPQLSAHFLIGGTKTAGTPQFDRKGTIVKTVDHLLVAHHAYSSSNVNLKYGANQRSIGIELIGFADGFRKDAVKKYENDKEDLAKAKAKLEKERATYEEALAKRTKEKEAGEEKVTVGKKKVPVDEAIANINKAIADIDAKIAALKLSKWSLDYEKLVAATRPDGVPLAFTYTDAQYAALGKLLEAIGKRYAYEKVCSHHWIIPAKKDDPGKLFDWSKLTPYLLPGTLSGDESGEGGEYTVSL